MRNATPASLRAAVSTSAAVGGAMDSDFFDMARKVLPPGQREARPRHPVPPAHRGRYGARARSGLQGVRLMDLGIAGRKAIVCASSRGLGRACAHRLAEAGCEVVVNGRDKAKARATAAEIAQGDRREGACGGRRCRDGGRSGRAVRRHARSRTSW